MSLRASEIPLKGAREKSVLAVLGAGCWGTTLASLQAENFDQVNLFTPEDDVCEEISRSRTNTRYLDDLVIPESVTAYTDIQDACTGASVIVLAVPSHVVREVARGLMGMSLDQAAVVIATKGLETNTGKLSLEVWREEAATSGRKGPRDAMVLSGPNLAREIGRGVPAVSVLAGLCTNELASTRGLLSHRLLTLFCHHDPLGVQAAGALKNVYAVGCGIASGLSWGDNLMGAIIWRGLEETASFAEALGGHPSSMMTPAGIGDFVTTCTSPLSRNHDLGRILAGSGGPAEGVRGVREGAQTAQEASRRAHALGLELTLLEAVWSVMTGAEGPRAIMEAACHPGPPEGRAEGRTRFGSAHQRMSALGLRPGVVPE
jgi:glycerol-3-phosphate dehydrogenase (NAD(P)+)